MGWQARHGSTVLACFDQVADAHCSTIDCAALSAMRGERFFVTSRKLTSPTDADRGVAPTLSSVVMRHVNMGLAEDMHVETVPNPTGDQLLRLIHGYYMSSMRMTGHPSARSAWTAGPSPGRPADDAPPMTHVLAPAWSPRAVVLFGGALQGTSAGCASGEGCQT